MGDSRCVCVLYVWFLYHIEKSSKQYQGVVTYASPIELFATGIKMESSDQYSF